jgi:site-specific DNA-cytosine methylase
MGMRMTAVALFAGIGGIERGLARAGIHSELLCEVGLGTVAGHSR